ncbi:MAG: MYG1 family protein [Nanoarchaeota archaeon]|jgi:uncharacterized UPF0160 family protein|nr:MYG1 family protein [Nanoarchaeota archaeon]
MKSKKLVIATHNSKFHADDIFSIVILKKIFGAVEIVRTRDEALLKKADFRVDVGNKYNHKTKDYDHHQENSPVRKNGVPYASCGLIWKHYGKKLVNSKEAFDYIDKVLFEVVDAGDNGIELNREKSQVIPIVEAISLFNSNWDEDKSNDDSFDEAVSFASLFFDRILSKANSISKGEDIVDRCLKEMKDGIVILSHPRLPKDKLSDSDAKFFIEPSTVDRWVSVGVPVRPKSFIRKKYFPDSWAGLLDNKLEEVSGVKGITFCHKHKFIISGKTKEAVLEATLLALNTE